MKIGIDSFACDGGKSGVGVYLNQILKRISPSGALYELFGWDYDRFAYNETAPDINFISQCRIDGKTANAIWHQAKYPSFAKSRSWDGCFFPAAHKQLPSWSPVPSVGTVHDMAAFWGTRKTREHLGMRRMILPNALRNLDRIIAVSRWVKQELIEVARVKESRIEVVSNGIDTGFFYPRLSSDETIVLIQPFSIQRPYILYVSRIDHPVKNHVRLINAFALFKEKTGFPHRLVLAGADSKGADAVKAAAAASSYRQDIFFTGYFPSSSLPELYAGAEMVVIPSMYEGFGMSVLEAMACGVAVACANAASLPEAAGNAALYFDPVNEEEMADRMITLATDRKTAAECRAQGLERIKAYSWDACAQRTLAIIQETT
ncbi:mannosyltransferase [Spirochaetia bacterium]|nr:mannosyltransferase [Spirochaetia bacterium]